MRYYMHILTLLCNIKIPKQLYLCIKSGCRYKLPLHLACQGHSKPQLIRFMMHKLLGVRKISINVNIFQYLSFWFIYFMKTAYRLFKLLSALLSTIKFKRKNKSCSPALQKAQCVITNFGHMMSDIHCLAFICHKISWRLTNATPIVLSKHFVPPT